MSLSEARDLLGLGSDEDPCLHRRELEVARERIAEMARNEADAELAARYQEGLMDFDKALATVREALGEFGLTAPAMAKPQVAKAPEAPRGPAASAPESPRSRHADIFVWLCIGLLGVGGGGWLFLKIQEEYQLQRQARIVLLEGAGAAHLENRRWPEAAAAYDEVEQLAPGSPMVAQGRRSIEVGMAEEQQQFVGYWTGQARAAVEAGRWDEAASAARQVMGKFPADKECVILLESIAVARAAATRSAVLATARALLDRRQWAAAIVALAPLLASRSDDPDARALLAAATAAKEKSAVESATARRLFRQALARDQGQFDAQGLDWLREASVLAPEDPEIAALLEKMSAYTRTLRVPRDFPTPREALANARDGDRITVNEGTWQGPLTLKARIELQGAGSDKTRVECPAAAGCAITLGPAANGTRISGITFRHESQTGDAERFSAGLIRGAAVALLDCQFSDACGHGLAVIEGGKASVNRCRFANNGWDGAAAMGAGSVLEIRDSQATSNFEHGIETWDGAALVVVNTRCAVNSRNGIHADNAQAPATIEGNQLIDNREFGLVLAAAGSGQVRKNTARGNLLGGLVIRAASRIPVTGNQLSQNQGPGLTLEKGLDPSAFADNSLSGNTGTQILIDFVFSPTPDIAP
ncbi:MAG: right-handed parallel beta-helix repeat-containing protein [Verrucomicrobiota bacterium]